MLFLFDYGDDWRFIVTCMKNEDTKSIFLRPEFLDDNGKAPDQYPDFEEE